MDPEPAAAPDVETLLEGAGFADDSWIGTIRRAEAPLPGFALGRYEILEEVCRGGQGVVYRALDSQTGRRVALKRLLAGALATASMRRRFERELEVASALDHPNIVTAFGAEIVDGVAVLAMEWVEGDRINGWAAQGGRSRATREVLGMFLKVCDAIAFAHRHGVIHRDLKPSNILVDQAGEPRVLDFGLAKQTQEAAGAGAAGAGASRSGEFVGTLAYAAPEQLRGGAVQADVRADVYSLGVILYELLTGALPFTPSGGPAELVDAIERGEPRLRGAGGRDYDGDLEAITLKALAADREARYQSADALATDVRAWLAGEPVSARVPGALTRIARALRRHRVAFTFAGTVFLLVAAFGIAQALTLEQVEREAAKANAISGFLQEMLASAHPLLTRRSDLTVREALDSASTRIGSVAAGTDVEAALRHVIGVTYHGLGEYDAAEPHLRRALEIRRALHRADHVDVAASLNELGHLMTSQGRFADAESHLRAALAMYRATRGESAEVATVLNNLAKVVFMSGRAAESEPLWRESLATRRRVLGEDDLLTIGSVGNLAGCLHGQRRLDEAEPLYREALARDRRLLGDDHTDVSDILHNFAALLSDTGRHAEALAAATECLEIRLKVLPEHHPNLGFAHNRLGTVCLAMGDVAAAERSFRDAIAVYEHSMPRRHPRVAVALRGLGRATAALGDTTAGEALLREALSIQVELLGESHPESAATREALAALQPGAVVQ